MSTKNKDPDFSKEVFKYDMKINKLNRSKIKNQIPCIIWFTGLSGAGKSTVADLLEQKLNKLKKEKFMNKILIQEKLKELDVELDDISLGDFVGSFISMIVYV